MPSKCAILLGLLRFGALNAADKMRVLSEYQAYSDSVGGGPHVEDPCFEVIESLRSYSTFASDEVVDAECRQILSRIRELLDRVFEDPELWSALTQRTVFSLPIGLELESVCKGAVACLAAAGIEDLPFWEVMCYTCD